MWRRGNTKYVHIMQLRGNIDSTMTYKVYKALKSFKGTDSVALGIVINSQGGSPAQAYQIAKRIVGIQQKYNLPVYTFAEDYAVSAAFLLHQLGDKRFSDSVSLLGKAGTSIQVTKWNQDYFDVNEFSTSEHNFRKQVDPLSKSEQDHGLLQKINDYSTNIFINEVKKVLSKKQLKMDEKQLSELYEGQTYTGRESLEQGLVDGNSNYLEQLKADFPQFKIVDLTKQTRREKVLEFLQNNKIMMYSQLV